MNKLALLFWFLIVSFLSFAQNPPGNGPAPNDATSMPITQGLIYLIGGAILLGVKKITERRKK